MPLDWSIQKEGRNVVLEFSAPEACNWAARMALADPVAGSSGMPAVGENMRAR